jgi:hypothetical protein
MVLLAKNQHSAALYPHRIAYLSRWGYLRDVLTRLPRMTNQDDLAPLLPKNWQPAG